MDTAATRRAGHLQGDTSQIRFVRYPVDGSGASFRGFGDSHDESGVGECLASSLESVCWLVSSEHGGLCCLVESIDTGFDNRVVEPVSNRVAGRSVEDMDKRTGRSSPIRLPPRTGTSVEWCRQSPSARTSSQAGAGEFQSAPSSPPPVPGRRRRVACRIRPTVLSLRGSIRFRRLDEMRTVPSEPRRRSCRRTVDLPTGASSFVRRQRTGNGCRTR